MAEIDEQTVRRVAELARLELGDDEVARLAGELEAILGHFEQLEDVDLEAAEERADDEDRSAIRADAPGTEPLAFGPDEMAPDWRGGHFVVPRLPGLGGTGDGGTDAGGDEGEGS